MTVGPRTALAGRACGSTGQRVHRGLAGVESARLRYRSAPIACSAAATPDGGVELQLERPAEAVAPGQLACLMAGDRVIGFGTIAEAA